MKISIIIPTYNHCDDLLKPCIDSIRKYTDLSDVEIIVVANGCSDNTESYLWDNPDIRFLQFEEPIGFTKAINEGISISKGDYLIFLNNDTELLPQEQNEWLDKLLKPFNEDATVGMTGPLKLYDISSNRRVLIFFCAMLSRKAFERIGFLDEIYSPGGGEDIDYSARLEDAGFKILQVPSDEVAAFTTTNTGNFPIWHKDNQTFKDIPEYTNDIIKRNNLLNAKKYNKHIKLNLGSGGVHHQGYLSVDLKDKRAHIMMDATKLDFEDNSIEEILASHILEHISPYRVMDTLYHWINKLKKGGKLIMELPDIEKLCKAFITADKKGRYGLLNCVFGAVNTTAEGNTADITAPHLWGWYPEMLYDHLRGAGFIDIQFMEEQFPHPGFNFRVEARKPV